MTNNNRHNHRLWLYVHDSTCHYCERRMSPPARERNSTPLTATAEHIQPRGRGGPRGAWNLVLACRDCNNLKGDLTLAEFVAVVAHMEATILTIVRTKTGHLKPLRHTPGAAEFLMECEQSSEAA